MPTPREFLSSVKGIVALVLTILGAVFLLVGAVSGIAAAGAQAAGAPGAVGLGVGAFAATFLVTGAVLAAVGLALGKWRATELRAREQLRSHGVTCEGVVIDIAQDFRVRVNRKHPWRVRYRYEVGGVQHEGADTSMDRPVGLEAGDAVGLVYDAKDPGRSALKPLAVRVAEPSATPMN